MKEGAGLEQKFAGLEVGSGAPDMPRGRHRFAEMRLWAAPLDHLLNDHPVRSCGNRGAGEDPDAFAGFQVPIAGRAREGFADDLQGGRKLREIGIAHRIAVHRGRIEGRGADLRLNRRCERPAMGLLERNPFGRKGDRHWRRPARPRRRS